MNGQMKEKHKDILGKYMPVSAVDSIYEMLLSNNISLKINKKRHSKLGDYRPATKTLPARITINNDLNPYEFLIVLVHELAHHYTFAHFGRKHQPHGQEWKNNFKELMIPYMNEAVFPEDLVFALKEYFFTYNLSPSGKLKLKQLLRTYNSDTESDLMKLDKVAEGQLFITSNGRVFKKLEKLRTRYMCVCMQTQRKYLIHQMAQVKLYEPDTKK